MATRLTFEPFSLLKPHIRHALNAPKHAPTTAQDDDKDVVGPGLHLVKTISGVFLQSNGRPYDLTPVYPKGLLPAVNKNWRNTAESMFGKDSFTEFLGVNEHMLEAPDNAALWIEVGEEEMTVSIVV